MSLHITPSVADAYVHRDKWIAPREPLMLGGVRLKWYDIARRETPVEQHVHDLAREHLTRASDAGVLDLKGDLGFVILHRCGADFYFLILNTWANENEIWEQVFAKENAATESFVFFPRQGPHLPTFCVWELGAVFHEQQAWRLYLYSQRDEAERRVYLADQYEGAI